eukprot:CAMPEP_0114648082 /NCGR_PEP_ID=MMETSP0191-20121206/6165_1 /TAXON_ID=126664 /ORGANISM="Sorites sp." /LENGTH=426 /DNA_ID=CAMNT_0001861295 /DNA_START=107 /DNA_END=1387 /DNA_ORIENTATION=+
MAVREVMDTINSVCRSRGGHYAGYSCQVVSWDDVSRGTVGGSLSCWGANITDTYLKSKTGTSLFTVRSDNWNEKLGVVSADEVAVVAGSGGRGPVQPVTLRSVLQGLGHFGGYAGLGANTNLYDSSLDNKCSIRFQTTFIPVQDSSEAQAKLEFATEAYNYNTMDDSDPRNLVLLCTSQGLAVQQDGRGAKKLFHHAVDDAGQIHRYWLEAEESKHKVGGEQRETEEERAEAQARGKATSSVIGVRAMGQRFNVLMTIQVPLKQKRPTLKSCPFLECEEEEEKDCMDDWDMCDSSGDCRLQISAAQGLRSAEGKCTAARVSRGSEYDVWPGLSVEAPERHESEHVTVTVVMYNTVKDGIPSAEDVAAAIDDLEALYQSCSENGLLGDDTFNFMKKKLKVADMTSIAAKLTFQPPAPVVVNHDIFPC